MTDTQVGEFSDLIEALSNLRNDTGVPKNVKLKLGTMIDTLKEPCDNSMLINKLLNDLEEMSNDINLQPFIRTQIFNISSMLETFQ